MLNSRTGSGSASDGWRSFLVCARTKQADGIEIQIYSNLFVVITLNEFKFI